MGRSTECNLDIRECNGARLVPGPQRTARPGPDGLRPRDRMVLSSAGGASRHPAYNPLTSEASPGVLWGDDLSASLVKVVHGCTAPAQAAGRRRHRVGGCGLRAAGCWLRLRVTRRRWTVVASSGWSVVGARMAAAGDDPERRRISSRSRWTSGAGGSGQSAGVGARSRRGGLARGPADRRRGLRGAGTRARHARDVRERPRRRCREGAVARAALGLLAVALHRAWRRRRAAGCWLLAALKQTRARG